MEELLNKVRIEVNDKIYLKDPESSELGRKIINGSLALIDEVGFEGFTFKKLGGKISSPEASIYRYFESKHKLLLYITSWYWGWMEYKVVLNTANIESPTERLLISIQLLTENIVADSGRNVIDTELLHRIVVTESSKAYLTKLVDDENREGVFMSYKSIVARVSDMILEINPDYRYPHMLVSTVIEGAHHQRFFAEHLPRLTDVVSGEDAITSFYQKMVLNTVSA